MYYYENVADAKGDAARKADIDRTGSKLKRILVSIEEELKGAPRTSRTFVSFADIDYHLTSYRFENCTTQGRFPNSL